MGRLRVLALVAAIALLHSASEVAPDRASGAASVAPTAPGPRQKPASPEPSDRKAELLAGRRLAIPVQGVRPAQLRDTFEASRGLKRSHQAIDIMAPWGTPVLAADDGKVAKITSNRGGGLTLYQVDGSGRLVYYYAHLAGYADGLREGQQVHRGEVIAYVGATGNAPAHAPHLHFAVLLLAQERRWWGGEALNPYAALTRSGPLTARR
jgi:murein DD-endopeptidase MepM/ murein hydrolase activator NlpD